MEYAFHVPDLEANCVVGEQGYPGISNLDNRISPIWRRANFRIGDMDEQVVLLKKGDNSWDQTTQALPTKVYERMKPGLRLATLLLQESGPFFSQLLHGRRVASQNESLDVSGDPQDWEMRAVRLIADPQHQPDVVAEQLRSFAEHVAENLLIYIPSQVDDDADAWAESTATGNEGCRYTLELGSDLAVLMCSARWHKASAQDRRYYNFMLANTLVHELAHVAWRYRRWLSILNNPLKTLREPIFFPDEPQIELGQSWERWCYGGEIRPNNSQQRATKWFGYLYSPFSFDTQDPMSSQLPDSMFGGNAITALSINQFFQREKWAAHKDGTMPLTIQQTPVCSTSAVLWTEDIGPLTFMEKLEVNHAGLVRRGSPLLESP